MRMAKTTKPDDGKPQSERFIETARALECDADKERFEEKLGKIATAQQARKKPKGR